MYGKICSVLFLSGLLLNTLRKSHICDHQDPISDEELVKIDNEALGLPHRYLRATLSSAYEMHRKPTSAIDRLLGALKFRTISHEDVEKIDYAQFEQFWEFMMSNFPAVFDQAETTFINKHTLLVKLAGSDKSLKPGLFLAHSDVVPTDPALWNSDPFEPLVENGYIHARGVFDNKGLLLAHFEAITGNLGFIHPNRNLD